MGMETANRMHPPSASFRPWERGAVFRFSGAGLISAAVHAVLIAVAAGVLIHNPGMRQAPIRVSFYDPAPPPPPLAPGAALNPAPVVPVEPKPVTRKEPVRKPIVRRPKPVEPKRQEPAATSASPAVAAAEPAGGGDPAGVAGGVPGGLAGGTLGGTGHMVLPAEQAAHLPVPIAKVMPEYPRMARQRGIEGQVVLEAVVDTDGKIEPDITVVQSVPPFDAATVAALRQWRFRPARSSDGTPLRVSLRVPFRFVLR